MVLALPSLSVFLISVFCFRVTMEDLAELSVDELLELIKIDEEKAKTLIMTARAPWFA